MKETVLGSKYVLSHGPIILSLFSCITTLSLVTYPVKELGTVNVTSVIKGTVSTLIIPSSSFKSKKSPSVFQSAYTLAPANSFIKWFGFIEPISTVTVYVLLGVKLAYWLVKSS